MTLDEYFSLPVTPMKWSPVGVSMQALLEKEPALDFEEVRRWAREFPSYGPPMKKPDVRKALKWLQDHPKEVPTETIVAAPQKPIKRPPVHIAPKPNDVEYTERYFDRREVVAVLQKNEPAEEPIRVRDVEISESPIKRNPLTEREKESLVEAQGQKCIYCARRFGSVVFDREKAITLQIRFDHFEPYALRQNNERENLFAACQLCNGFKSDLIFDSLNGARTFLSRKWESAGLSDKFPGAKPFLSDVAMFSLN
jgi:5-methylcytosine-specific restriction endonuclease McrA